LAVTVLPELIALVGFLYLSFDDIRRREISEKHVALIAALILAADVVAKPWSKETILPPRLYVVLNLVLVAGVAVAALLRTLGWGDVVVLVLIFLASPTVPRDNALLPTLMVVLFYYLLLMAIYMLYNLVSNILFHRKELWHIPSLRLRVAYALMARPMKAGKLAENPGWWYPLNLCGNYRLRFDLYLNPPDISREVRRAIGKGCMKKDDIVWVTYGIPAIPLLTAAYLLALLVGDTPITALLGLGGLPG